MSTYETVIVIGMVLWILVAIGILIGLVRLELLVRRTRRPLRRTAEMLERAQERLDPVMRNAERASEDVNYIVSSLRADVGEVGGSIRRVSESTDRMVAIVEERVAEINGLLDVVQEEAEESFYSTASLLRALRGGGGRDSERSSRRGRLAGGER